MFHKCKFKDLFLRLDQNFADIKRVVLRCDVFFLVIDFWYLCFHPGDCNAVKEVSLLSHSLLETCQFSHQRRGIKQTEVTQAQNHCQPIWLLGENERGTQMQPGWCSNGQMECRPDFSPFLPDVQISFHPMPSTSLYYLLPTLLVYLQTHPLPPDFIFLLIHPTYFCLINIPKTLPFII